jgi:AcrR family transcriptional regulator
VGPPSSKDAILAAARRVMLERGPGRATFSAIATEAGVSRVTVYKWFPTRDDLNTALEAHETARFIDGLAEVVAEAPTRAAKLDAAIRHLVTYIDEEPAWAKGVATDPSFPLASLRSALVAHPPMLIDVLGDALTAVPAVRRGTVTPHEAVDAILRLAYSHYLMPHRDPDALLATIRGLLSVPT